MDIILASLFIIALGCIAKLHRLPENKTKIWSDNNEDDPFNLLDIDNNDEDDDNWLWVQDDNDKYHFLFDDDQYTGIFDDPCSGSFDIYMDPGCSNIPGNIFHDD